MSLRLHALNRNSHMEMLSYTGETGRGLFQGQYQKTYRAAMAAWADEHILGTRDERFTPSPQNEHIRRKTHPPITNHIGNSRCTDDANGGNHLVVH